ncbi:hypothetical protein [Chromobacterium paludis]|uniref:Uncharacterized protein n=1 Tax=Chromobacterium paludis TaxID=2605945 RepID=A0A5C1DH26_9NEIS|nr:hypothetical protein [Chromobacterium paludis]QEL56016.1 hypothetical protein FYK34_10835 [Chromobacterium paludis]
MISAAAVESLERICEQALREGCGAGEGGPCALKPLGERLPMPEGEGGELILLNIASYQFRLAMLFQFEDDAAMKDWLARWVRSGAPLTAAALRDAHGELANRICGAVNRALCAVFRHVGMSTPLGVGASSLRHLELLNSALRRSWRVEMDGGAHFWLTACLSLSKGASLDFRYQPPSPEEQGVGELELF